MIDTKMFDKASQGSEAELMNTDESASHVKDGKIDQ